MSSVISNYTQAARLASPQTNLSKVVGGSPLGEEGGTLNPAFKNELTGAIGTIYQGLKAQGKTAETHATQHIMGVGNVEQTAVSLADLNSNLEIIATALRTAVEKINELTTRSMG